MSGFANQFMNGNVITLAHNPILPPAKWLVYKCTSGYSSCVYLFET